MLQKLFASRDFRISILYLALLFLAALIFFNPLIGGRKVLQQSDVVSVTGMQKNPNDYEKAHPGERAYWSESMFSGMPSTTFYTHYSGNIFITLSKVLMLGLPYQIMMSFVGMAFFFALLRACKVSYGLAAAGGFAYVFFSYHTMLLSSGHTNKFLVLMTTPGVLWALLLAYNGKPVPGSALLALLLGLNLYFNHLQMTYYLLFVVACIVVYYLVLAIRTKLVKQFVLTSVLLGVAAAIALFANAVPLYPLANFTQFTIRGPNELVKEKTDEKTSGLKRDSYAYSWSYDRNEMTTLLVPNAMGGGSGGPLTTSSATYKAFTEHPQEVPNPVEQIRQLPLYWGTQPFTDGPVYVGAIVVFLFVAGLILVESGLKWALLYATLLSVLLSLGGNSFSLVASLFLLVIPILFLVTKKYIKGIPPPLYGLGLTIIAIFLASVIDGDSTKTYRFSDLLFDYLPLYNKFRAPVSMLVIVAMTAPWLAMLGAEALLDEKRPVQERKMALYYAGGITAGICLFLALVPGLFFNFTSTQDASFPDWLKLSLQQDRESLLRADAFRSFAFIALAGGAIWAYIAGQVKEKNWIISAVLLLVVIDLWVVDQRLLPKEKYVTKVQYQSNFTPRPADSYLLEHDSTYFRVFPLSRNWANDGSTPYFLNTIGGYNPAKLRRYQDVIEKHLSSNNLLSVINMLNTKYVIYDKPLPSPQFQAVYKAPDGEIVYRNLTNYGPAWIVHHVEVMPTPDDALDTLKTLFLLETAAIEKKQASLLGAYSQDTVDHEHESITLLHHDNQHLRYSYHSAKTRFVTFSEVYYPDWHATIDGKPAQIFQTDYVLRGVVVPAGDHEIKFDNVPEVVNKSERVSLYASVALVLFLGVAIAVEVVQGRKKKG